MVDERYTLNPVSAGNTGPHRHNYRESGNYLVCDCGKKKLHLKDSEHEGILIGVKSDGLKYSVRQDRHRYLFPGEWKRFIEGVKNSKHRLFFLSAVHTGARAMELLHLKAKNFDFERGTVQFEVTKQRKAKKSFTSLSKSRTFFVSDRYLREVKKFIKEENKALNDYLFMDNKELPANYDNLDNGQKKAFYKGYETAYGQVLKRRLKMAGIKDWRHISLHNLRKTYGNWMRIFDLRTEEICYRLGHDFATYMLHYGSPLIFTQPERQEIMGIFGQVK